jgi:hypothetical protein
MQNKMSWYFWKELGRYPSAGRHTGVDHPDTFVNVAGQKISVDDKMLAPGYVKALASRVIENRDLL